MLNIFKKKTMNFKNISPEELNDLKSKDGYIVLDVRAPQEAAEGLIKGAVQANFFAAGFKSELEKLDKSKNYLVYCRSGNRSSKACSMMDSMGFENLYNLLGGIGAWNRFVANK
jgi:rhodanese-related sulfurtransferase